MIREAAGECGRAQSKAQTEISAWQHGLILLLTCSVTAAQRHARSIVRSAARRMDVFKPCRKVSFEMKTQIGIEGVTRQSTRRFSFRTLVLVGVWVVLISMYLMFVTVAAGIKANTSFIDTLIFGGAILCAGYDRSRIPHVVAVAIPLFGLFEWLRAPALSAAFLTLGLGGVIILAFHAVSGSQIAKQNFQITVVLPLFVLLANFVNGRIVHFTPHLLDAALLRADCGVSMAVYRWTLARPFRMATAYILYGSLPLAASSVLACTTGRARSQLLRALCFAALLAVPCYVLVPAVGPAHIGQPLAYRNCMPSLHVTWAALLWLNARPVWLRRAAFGFMLIIAFTTLATGEHYVLDLVAAVPFTWIVQRLSEPTARLRPEMCE